MIKRIYQTNFKHIISTILALLVTLLFGLVSMQSHAQNNHQTTPQYRLNSGDKIKVLVFGQDELSGEFQIDANGRISLPLIKDVQAATLTVAELETSITQRLSPDYLKNPKVSIEVLNYRPFYILGEVKNPGQYPYTNGMTVLTAVALAGGYTYRAKTSKAYITSQQQPDLKQTTAQSQKILPGDVIEIPEKFWLF